MFNGYSSRNIKLQSGLSGGVLPVRTNPLAGCETFTVSEDDRSPAHHACFRALLTLLQSSRQEGCSVAPVNHSLGTAPGQFCAWTVPMDCASADAAWPDIPLNKDGNTLLGAHGNV